LISSKDCKLSISGLDIPSGGTTGLTFFKN
jgi:hypothetical protein